MFYNGERTRPALQMSATPNVTAAAEMVTNNIMSIGIQDVYMIIVPDYDIIDV
jgi:hypothetical protein